MPANICVPLFKGGEKDQTVRVTAAVVGKTFGAISATIESGPELTTATLPSTYDGGNLRAATCGAGLKADGVFAYDQPTVGGIVPLIRQQGGAVVPVTAGAAITAGVQVEVGANGKAITFASGIPVGKATTTAVLNGDCYVELY